VTREPEGGIEREKTSADKLNCVQTADTC